MSTSNSQNLAASNTSSSFANSKPCYPRITGHRGYKAKFPENTIASFNGAIAAGTEIIELDVQVAGDGTIVISHDANTRRCFGVAYDITKTPYYGVIDKLRTPKSSIPTSLALADKSRGISTAEHEAELKDPKSAYRMPTFKDIAELFANDPTYQNVKLMVDIKITNDPWIVPHLVKILEFVNPDIKGFWAPRVVFGIWRLDVLESAKKHSPYIPVVFIGISRELAQTFIDTGVIEENVEVEGTKQIQKRQLVQGISLKHVSLLSFGADAILQSAKERGILVYMWTVNSISQMKWAIASDIAGVISDHVDVYKQLRQDLEDSSKKNSAPSLEFSSVSSSPVIISQSGEETPVIPTTELPSSGLSQLSNISTSTLIDCGPIINAGSPDQYIKWSDYYIWSHYAYIEDKIRFIFKLFYYQNRPHRKEPANVQ